MHKLSKLIGEKIKAYTEMLSVDITKINLRGNPKKAQKKLNFKPKYSFLSLIKNMIDEDLLLAQEELNKKH